MIYIFTQIKNIIMKKINSTIKKVGILAIFGLFFASCKNEEKKDFSESVIVKEIKSNTFTDNVNREEFAKNIYPLVDSLYKNDTLKYGLLNHIAKKTANEPNPEIFEKNFQDFKGEVSLIK